MQYSVLQIALSAYCIWANTSGNLSLYSLVMLHFLLTLFVHRHSLFSRPNVLVLMGSFIGFSVVVTVLRSSSVRATSQLYSDGIYGFLQPALLLSILLTDLTIVPYLEEFGSNMELAREVMLQWKSMDQLHHHPNGVLVRSSILLTLLIGWVSCYVYPLDWDEEWQRFPFPTVTALLASHIVTCVCHIILEYGQSWNSQST